MQSKNTFSYTELKVYKHLKSLKVKKSCNKKNN